MKSSELAPLLFTVYLAAASGRSPALPCFAAFLALVCFSGLFAFTQLFFQTRGHWDHAGAMSLRGMYLPYPRYRTIRKPAACASWFPWEAPLSAPCRCARNRARRSAWVSLSTAWAIQHTSWCSRLSCPTHSQHLFLLRLLQRLYCKAGQLPYLKWYSATERFVTP